MQEQAKKTLIGAFVVGALALGVGGVLAFGGGNIFEEHDRYVVYFEGFVDGLEPGSPVMFRGVKIGEVDSLRLMLDRDQTPIIEVLVSIPRRDLGRASDLVDQLDQQPALDDWIARGMRAQLGTVSLLTGQLKVDVDLFPGAPIQLRRLRSDLPEVPAIASSRERISAAVQSIPYETLAQALTEILTGLRDLVNSPEMQELGGRLSTTLDSIQGILAPLEERLPDLLEGVDVTLDVARNTAEKTDRALAELEQLLADYRAKGNLLLDEAHSGLEQAKGTLAKLDAEIEPTSATFRATLDEARVLMQTLNDASGPGAPIAVEVRRALQKLSRALDAITSLADVLERQPESILKGKSGG